MSDLGDREVRVTIPRARRFVLVKARHVSTHSTECKIVFDKHYRATCQDVTSVRILTVSTVHVY